MGKKKGLSVDEKRDKLQEFLHETKEVFTMKQLETQCSKKKGIVSQTVKDIAQSLVSDDLIQSDKIGINVLYWSFPSQSLIVRENKLNVLNEQVAALKKSIEETQQKIEESLVGKEETAEREEALQKQAEVQEKNNKLKANCQKFAKLDPEFLDKQRKQRDVAFEAANRWTDNIYALRSHCIKEMGIQQDMFDSHFEITESFDYIEMD